MKRVGMLKRIAGLFLISCLFFALFYAFLFFVHSSATPMIGIIFVSIVAWKRGTVDGLILIAFNFFWIGVGFRLLSPEYARSFSLDGVVGFGIHIGVAFLLGYFGRLAADLRKEKASLKKLQNELEERVETRTRELEKANEKLFQAQKMEAIGHLAGSMAHDFNNYLSVILGYSALMTKKLDEKAPVYGYAQTIERTAETAAKLTSQLLTFARKKKYRMQPVNLNDLIKGMIALLSSAVQRGITITHITEPKLPLLQGGVDLIKSALLNLCLNARDAMKNSGTLTIATKTVRVTPEYCRSYGITCAAGTYAGVSVTDTGSGIEPDVFNHLFEPFFTTKEEGKGTGMGLAAVYGIAQSHKGAVFAETQLGKGTTFTKLFPVAAGGECGCGDPPA